MQRAENGSKEKYAGLTPYYGSDPFVFVSYSHDQVVKVEGVLRLLQRAGIRYWYDQQGVGITAGKDWKSWITNRLEHCAMFLCFLANGVEQRREVLDEITMAIERQKAGGDFRVVFIFLEKMPAKVFERADAPVIEEYISHAQYISYNGITETFLRQLFARDVFPDSLVREEYLEAWKNRQRLDLVRVVNEALVDNPYICETFFPEKREEDGFYRVRMDQIDPDAVCLVSLDNQWCPKEFYDSPSFWKEGFMTEEAVRIQGERQAREIFRALLHHRQLIVNRAFFFNSRTFGSLYEERGGDYQALCSLLANGSLLVYLTKEDKPYDPEKPPAFAAAYYDLWGQLCRSVEVFCLRLDWTDAVSNGRKVDQLLYQRIQTFCLTLAEDRYQLNELAAAFGLEGRRKRDFEKIWRDVQFHAAARDRDEHAAYTREVFYKRFLVKPGTDVSDCILDIRKAFVPELKEIIDFQYGVNLPNALGVQPLYPAEGRLKDFCRAGQMLERSSRELSAEELSCAVGQFEPEFLLDAVSFPWVKEMSLDEIVLLREMDEWKAYIRTVSNGRKRAHLQEVDFYDISYVWERFYEWMDRARERTARENRIRWETIPGAVSVIYRLGGCEIVTVYHAGRKEIDVRSSLDGPEEIPEGQNHTVLVTIDYVCADILAGQDRPGGPALAFDLETNFLLAELRLFEGMSKEPLSVIYTGLMDRLRSMPHRMIPRDREKLEQAARRGEKQDSQAWREYIEKLQLEGADLYQERRYQRRKRNRSEWIWYLELMEGRPEQFRPDPMLEIVTDLDEICRYERAHQGENVTIGVRYKSPYSMLVVDLVRDADGNVFPYERVLPAIPRGAVVCVPVCEGRFVLLEQFRHALRAYQLAFPRGYAEEGLTGAENAAKELREELGAEVLEVKALGGIVADSGASGNRVEVYACTVSEPRLKERYEGIRRLVRLTREELLDLIARGEITDGFTLGAMELLEARDRR